jgi:protocatechuate 3,4-dioxygenase beta subunit
MSTSSIMAVIDSRLASRWFENRDDELELGWVIGRDPPAIISRRGRGIQRMDGDRPERRTVERAMAAVAAAVAAVVVYLLIALAGGGDDGAPAPRDAAGRAATRAGGGSRPDDPARPALEPRKGSGAASITGSVTDAGGQPVTGVWVTAELEEPVGGAAAPPDGGLDLDAVVVAETGAEGAFALEGAFPGRHRLRVEGPGILTAEVRFVDAPGEAVRILVSREVQVKGVVIDADGAPAPGVTVRLVGRAGGAAVDVTTVADGAFAITSLAEGSYRAYAFREDRASPAAPVDRLGRGPFLPVVLVLQPAAVIAGRVIDARDTRGVAAEVTLIADDPDEPPRSARSAADGSFRIEGVPLARWTADAFAPGYISADAVRFEAAADYAPVIALERGGVVTGRVIDGDRRAIAGAIVVAHPLGGGDEVSESAVARRSAGETSAAPTVGWQGGMVTATGLQFIPRGELGVVVGPLPFPPAAGTGAVRVAAPVAVAAAALPPLPVAPELVSRFRTDPDGTFRVAGLSPGRYRIAATHPDFADGGSRPLDVALGQEHTGIDIVLSAGLTLAGQVTDDGGVAVAGATVQARARAGGSPRQAVTGPDGRYSLGPLPAAFQVQVSAAGYGTAARDIAATLGRAALTREENFILTRADAVLEGRLTDSTGFAVRGATLRVAGGPGTAAPAHTDDSGRFRLAGLPAGRYLLRVEHPDYPVAELEARTGIGNSLEVDFGGRLSGLVRDRSTSAPIAGAAVVLRGPRGARVETTAGATGEVAAGPLHAGRWTVEATARGYARAATTVEVTAGRRPEYVTARDVRIDLLRSATLAGTVRDQNGERVAGAQITAGAATATSDEQGRFRMTDAPSGALHIEVRKGTARGSHSINLSPGEEAVTLELRLGR